MIWATALLLPLALPARENAHARSRSQMGWAAVNQRGQISRNFGRGSISFYPDDGDDDDVAVKLVGGREKIFEKEMNRIDQRTLRKRDHLSSLSIALLRDAMR